MAGKLMYIPNVNTQNYPFYRLQLVGETFGHLINQHSLEVPKVFKPQINKL